MNKIIDRLERSGHDVLLPDEHCPEFECVTDAYMINGNVLGTKAQIRRRGTLDLVAEYNSMLDSITTYAIGESELPAIYNIFVGDADV